MTQPAAAQHFADPVAASNFAAYRAEQIKEYGQYVATEQIVYGGVPIFAAGAQVPASTVEANEWLLPLVTRTAPPELPGEDRGEVLRTRAQQLADELAAINAELADAEETETEDEGGSAYESMTIPQLRAELASRELPTSGNKPELLERLYADDDKPDEPAVPVDDTDETPEA